MKFYALFFFLLFMTAGCDKTTPGTPEDPDDDKVLGVEPSTSLINLSTVGVKTYQDLRYGPLARNFFDFFAPESTEPTSLLIYIHGGGFTQGDKNGLYGEASFSDFVDDLLESNIAFVSINYSLIGVGDTEGVLKSLADSKRALQFIRLHADELNINKDKIVLCGSSAGAGTSLWIGLQDDLADIDNSDEVLRESTRVQGIIAIETQSSYDVLNWHNSTFHEYQDDGIGFDELLALSTELYVNAFYGVSTLAETESAEILADRANLDMLAHISSDDPEIYLSNTAVDYVIPTDGFQLLHHPLHAKAILDETIIQGVSSRADITPMGINTTNGEGLSEFVIRKIGN